MGVIPDKSAFLKAVERGGIPPLYIGPLKSPCGPVDVFETIGFGEHSFLLESARTHPGTGRYSYLGGRPYMVFTSKAGESHLERHGRKTKLEGKPLAALRNLMAGCRVGRVDGLPPFVGGCAGFLSYDFVHNFERLPGSAVDDLGIPDACFMFVDSVVSFDHIEGKLWLTAIPGAATMGPEHEDMDAGRWSEAYDEAAAKLEGLHGIVMSAKPSPVREHPRTGGVKALPLIPKERYEEMVRRAKEYIAAGDIFQANLSQRLSADVGGNEPWDIYRVLREVNPSPFASYIDLPEVKIVSSSPERLVRLSGDVVDTRPIAGTRPRGKDTTGDEAMRSELLLNEKERAEHIMLIDLERNDLGRVCDYGSVHVDELMVTEDYSHVIHIVSNVTGTLAKGRDAFDVIQATFPGGTITGVPKVRCMEIIDELEPVARGPYTGSAGYICGTGDMDLNIVIRTFVIKDGVAHVQVGAGIVADSDPEREYYETLHKAEALIKTLGRL